MVSLTGGASNQTAGVMIRETLNANSKSTYANIGSGSYLYFNYRATTGGSTSYGYLPPVTLPYWVKIVRSGSTFTGYAAPDGVSWVQISSTTISMAQSVYIGLAVSSGSTGLATATFDNVSISSSSSPAPVISSLSGTTGSIGTQIAVNGSNFGSSQGSSIVTLNGAAVPINFWSASGILVTIPTGATSGPMLAVIGPSMNDSNSFYFTVTSQPLPTEWLDQDVGTVGSVGRATYSSGTFTVVGGGTISGTYADGFHFAYQPLSGDGTIVARVVSLTGGTTNASAGVMIRETLASGSTNANASAVPGPYVTFFYRTSTAALTSAVNGGSAALPYWVKVVRSGTAFSGYMSIDNVNWVQIGNTQTITMAQNVYVGLAVASGATSSTTTAAFDNLSITSNPDPAPVITSVSATTGSIGSQVSISGSNFGASQGGSVVTLNGASVPINFWSATSIIITIPTGATSGPLLVSFGADKNDSNYVYFTVTSQPLPVGWLDADVGQIGTIGSATFSNGTFTVSGSGLIPTGGGNSDGFHFAYQTMSGDGTVVARVVSLTGGTSYASAGVMIRETLAQGATNANTSAVPGPFVMFFYRTTTAGGTTTVSGGRVTLPYWVKVVRAGNSFSGYMSSNGTTWVQVGSTQTISMGQSVYVGLAVGSGSTSSTTTATFDNGSITVGTTPYLSGLSPSLGGVGTSVTIAGSNFGATQGSSTITFNGATASVTSWTSSQIVATVPAAVPAGTGPVSVTVNSIASVPVYSFTAIKPVISSLAPPAAPLGGSVVVSGSAFGANMLSSQVQFNGVAGTVTSWSDTSITVAVPSNATSGSVAVIEDGFSSNTAQFTVIEAISVSTVSPTAGPIGSTVTISGAGFGATQSNSVASFYGAAANVVTWNDTQIVATVPSGASTGNVTVTVAGNTAQGPLFTLTSALTLTDSLGNTTTYNSQAIGGVWQVTASTGSGCSSCTQRGTISSTYDANGNALTKTDELGHTTTYTYDSNGNVLTVSKPDGNGNTPTTSYTYTSFGQVLTTTDPLGNATTNAYDSKGNLLSVTSPRPNGNTNASLTQFAYDTKGELTTITDPLNNVTALTYTSVGMIATIKDAQNNVTTYGYDTHGNRTSVTDALNHQTTFTYDSGDRLKTITYPDTTTTTFVYDTRGRRTSVTDQNGKTTTYAYDDADRLTSVTDAATNVTTYGYDTENNLTSIKDANNHTTSFTYDAFGRVTKTTFPSGYIETYAYDAVGNLTSKTDRKNQLLTYTYDQLNRLAQKSYPDTTTVNYTYDLDSRLTQVTDPTGTYQFTFDNMGRLTSASTSFAFLTARSFTNGYSYDAASNRTGFTDPENGSTTYVYDTLNRLQTLTPPAAFSGTGSFGFSYDALSRRTQMTRPNNVAANYAYDNLSHLQSVLHQVSGTTIDGASYGLDNAGNRTSKTDQRAGVTSNHTYDAIYELTGVTQGTNTTESYTYDPVGNRLSSLGVSPYSVNVSNELTSIPSTSYTYDNNGNTQTKVVGTNTTSYAWDFENRLTSVTLPGSGGTVTFKYDPFGRRIYKSSAAGTSIYAYDGDNLVEETNSSGTAVARYSQALNFDEPLAMLRSSTTSYYDADGLGSVTSLSNSAGSLAQTYGYDSFGKQTSSSGSLTNPFQYTARELDSETSLYYYRARYYDPSTGRFLSQDPIVFIGGVNFYRYVRNSATNFGDPGGTNTAPLPIETEPVLGPVATWCAANPILCLGIFDGALLVNDAYGGYKLGVAYGLWGNPSSSDTQRQREYDLAKRFCDSPAPAGSNPCATLRNQIDHALKCIALYEAWDAKWDPGRHADKITDWKKRLQNLKDQHKRDCTDKCS
jgi:RHS repeat-associated protein